MTNSGWFTESATWHQVTTVDGRVLASAPKLATALELALDFSKHQGCPMYLFTGDRQWIEVDYWKPLRNFEVKKAA